MMHGPSRDNSPESGRDFFAHSASGKLKRVTGMVPNGSIISRADTVNR